MSTADLRAAVLDLDPSDIEPTTSNEMDSHLATDLEWVAFQLGAGAGMAAMQDAVLALIDQHHCDEGVRPDPEDRWRLVRVGTDMLDQFGTRTERGERITAEWGEPDARGVYELTFTVHSDDTLGVRVTPETLIEALRWVAERYGKTAGNDAIDYFPEAEAWAEAIIERLSR